MPESPRPNILWITCEDIGPHLGCYGDHYADTPNLDALAARGVIYTNAWSETPVCAPARTNIISGCYATSTGAEHMRSHVPISPTMRMYPQLLRDAGYWCTNNSKEDYNLEKPGAVWDDSSETAHWRDRADGRPFFAIFNDTITHESKIRARPWELEHDPADAPVPPYHPDTPEVRRDWAQYYDTITKMDANAGAILAELEEDGLVEDTIIVFYGDHGSGMPGQKRCARDAGLRVPLIVVVPEKFAHLAADDYEQGGATPRLVGFTDLAPTTLSTVGVEPPAWMQGRAFMGEHEAPPRRYLYGHRGRMDERYDMVRCVRDERHIYIRNFMPHLPMGQHVRYMFETATTQVWKRLHDAGELTDAQGFFWEERPAEELYDLREDPHETRNLAGSADHADVLDEMRQACREWMLAVRDTGCLPEPQIHSRSAGRAPYEMARDPEAYPMARILESAETASSLEAGATESLLGGMSDEDAAVRYWSALGLLMRGERSVRKGHAMLREALGDADASVRLTAAEALCRYGGTADVRLAMPVLLELADAEANGPYVAMMALNAVDRCGDLAEPWMEQLRSLPTHDPTTDERPQLGAAVLLEKITGGR
ncbi:MAG: sulfatase-like hydrolase/transferase [Armatimonadota bacterium]|jgi:arylsulfatase A-like enzyme